MKNFFMIFALIAIFSVSGCWKNAYPKQEAFNDADEVAEHDSDGIESDDEDNNNNFPGFPDFDLMENPDKDPCDDLPCFGIIHADKCRAINNRDYVCVCETGWYWDGEDCVSPCEPNPCSEVAHSTGTCSMPALKQYICECETGYFWNGDSCVNPCDNASCNKQANSTGGCISLSPQKYNCVCKESYFWNGEKCAELPECSSTSGTPCKDSATGVTWSSIQYADLYNTDCSSLSESGITDWHVASIGELRSLIIECPSTMLGSSCEVSEECNSKSCYTENCLSCDGKYGGQYSKLGDRHILLSSTTADLGYIWEIGFYSAAIGITSCPGWMNDQISNMCESSSYFRCARCDEGYFWYKNKCIESPCAKNPCKNIPNASPDYCFPKTDTTFDCLCEKDYYWDGSECFLTPCLKEPCKNIPHADPEWCNHTDATTFICKCDENYIWNGTSCVPSKCIEEPCKDIPHAYNSCTPVTEEEYYCSCIKSYDWGGESYEWDGEKCVSPCDSKPCEGLPYSDGVCDVTTDEIYVCGCTNPAYWDQRSKRCVNLCDDDPCAGDPNSTGVCYSKSGPDYSCQCIENHIWSASLKKCVACNEGLCNIPHSDGTCKKSNSSANSYECGCVDGYVWNSGRCIIPCDNNFVNEAGECINPCATAPCSTMPHALDGSCHAWNDTFYTCLCEEGYGWYDYGCILAPKKGG